MQSLYEKNKKRLTLYQNDYDELATEDQTSESGEKERFCKIPHLAETMGNQLQSHLPPLLWLRIIKAHSSLMQGDENEEKRILKYYNS